MKNYSGRPLPTEPQARLLAAKWGDNEPIKYGGYDSPTTRVCVRKGWFDPDGTTGHHPSGSPWAGYRVSKLGVVALENFLCQRRLNDPNAH